MGGELADDLVPLRVSPRLVVVRPDHEDSAEDRVRAAEALERAGVHSRERLKAPAELEQKPQDALEAVVGLRRGVARRASASA